MHPAARAGTVLLLVAVALAGCLDGGTADGDGGGDGAKLQLRFSGDRAYRHVLDQVRRPDGSDRYRISGTEGNDAVAAMLVENWTRQGWGASMQYFDGRTFLSMDKHPMIEQFVEGPSCNATERRAVENTTFHNVRATQGGGPEVLLTAHYDTKATADQAEDPGDRDEPVLGADDGASGVAVLWELARVLPGRFHNVTVTFVAFDAEDGWDVCYPSAGSTYFANRMTDARRDRVRAVINLDMVGNASARFPREGASRDAAPQVVDLVWGEAARQNVPMFRGETGTIGDDHLPFIHRGMPAIDVIHAPFPPYWHTTGDTPERVDAETLEQVGRVVEAIVLRIDRGALQGTG